LRIKTFNRYICNLAYCLNKMNIDYSRLTANQRAIAIQRLTALWAFTESGLGGIMHAFKIPFTGLLVGGMAVVMICMIAEIAERDYGQVLKSAVIVLIVKAMVSPHTPPPAYIAVSFQALLGYGLFRLMGVNLFSILLLSTIAMIESAIQKILLLTLFYGASLWKAVDELVSFLIKQFGIKLTDGSYWIVGIYLGIYLVGGIVIALLAKRSIRSFYARNVTDDLRFINKRFIPPYAEKKKNRKRLWTMIIILTIISVILFLFAPDQKRGWVAVSRTVSWTLSAILVWYLLISPLLTKLIKQVLKKKQGKYNQEVLQVISFLPVLKRLTTLAWQHSKTKKGFNRWYTFFSSLIHWSLVYSDTGPVEIPVQYRS
jgi:hypothetical protein